MKRSSGVLMHISSLPSSYGIGDMGPGAYSFADFCSQTMQSYWQVLPLNPTNSACGDSPYFSASSNAGNPFLISPEILRDEGLLSADEINHSEVFSDNAVKYERVESYKMRVLDIAWNRCRTSGIFKNDFEKFCSEEDVWLNDFALFKALKQRYKGVIWARWPEPLKNRDVKALRQAYDDNSEMIDREKFYQFLFFKQWFALKSYCNNHCVKIIGDIPIYVAYDSVDVWANQHIFKLDKSRNMNAVSGVPPDYFSATGQLWNTPVYSWPALKESGYRWWIQRMQAQFKRYDIVRIDHFRGLVQYWEVPAGEKTAVNGKWVEVPVYDFFDKLTASFPDFPIIAEDLGIITDDVREVMRHYGFPGMKILLFAFGENNPQHPYLPHNFDTNCVVYTGTHDNNTLRGWFEEEASEEDRRRLFGYIGRKPTIKELNWELIRLAMGSVAEKVIIPVQDLLGLGGSARMNNPSTGRNNWRWRLTATQFEKIQRQYISDMTKMYARECSV